MNTKKLNLLKKYLANREDISFAFLFGSRAKNSQRKISDWDIAIYFKLSGKEIEWETNKEYNEENKIWNELKEILGTDSVDMIVLNRAPAKTSSIILQGVPLVIKDKRLYLEFMLIVTREAEDFSKTMENYAEIYWRSKSLSKEDIKILEERLIFLDTELSDIDQFRKLNEVTYEREKSKKREVERWIENILNATIDIAKTIIASDKKPMPSTYREILKNLDSIVGFSKGTGEKLSQWAHLRNILAHEYLDIRWKRINSFIQNAESNFGKFIVEVKRKIEFQKR